MRVTVEKCGATTEVRIYEEADGVNPPRCIQIFASQEREGLTFGIHGGLVLEADEDGDLPRLMEGTVR